MGALLHATIDLRGRFHHSITGLRSTDDSVADRIVIKQGVKRSSTIGWLAAANAFFAVFHPQGPFELPAPMMAGVVGAVLLVMPALGWRARFGSGTRLLGAGLGRDVAISTITLVAVLILHRIAGAVPTQASMWNSTWVATNVGFVAALWWPRPVVRRRALTRAELVTTAIVFPVSFAFFYFGATSVVPPLRDQDHEVHATGYGLVTRFEPFLLTDRHTFHFFAHPPLLHLIVAGSFLYSGDFQDLRYYNLASARALAVVQGTPGSLPDGPVARERNGSLEYEAVGVEGMDYVLQPLGGGPRIRASAETIEVDLIARRYETYPHILSTRSPNVFLAAATVTLLMVWGTRMTRRPVLGVLLAAVYATSPEVFVRSSYGGYFAIGAFVSVLILLAVEHAPRVLTRAWIAPAFLGGALAALSDHKLVLLPVAAAFMAWTPLGGPLREPGRKGLLVATIAGFALGTAVFWTYGLVTAPAAFLQDHLGTHLIDRITHNNPLGYQGYPTLGGLWTEFLSHSGYLLVPIAILAVFVDLKTSPDAAGALASRRLWLAWIICLAVVFSVVDWRMTKHLAPMLLALHLALLPSRSAPRWRTGLALLAFGILLAFNVPAILQLKDDFAGFSITPAW